MKDNLLTKSIITEGKFFSQYFNFFSHVRNSQVKECNVPKFEEEGTVVYSQVMWIYVAFANGKVDNG